MLPNDQFMFVIDDDGTTGYQSFTVSNAIACTLIVMFRMSMAALEAMPAMEAMAAMTAISNSISKRKTIYSGKNGQNVKKVAVDL